MTVPKETSVCLLCGTIVCLKQRCCVEEECCEAVRVSGMVEMWRIESQTD